MSLTHKIDFMLLVSVSNANPNGDPLNGNRPRENYEGLGEISDVCLKRKIRNRLQDMGEEIFVQSDDRASDGFKSLKERAEGCKELETEIKKGKKADQEKCKEIACRQWLDVRSFGQVFAFKGVEVSLGIRGPVTLHQAVSVSPVDIVSMQITKSVNSESGKDSKASDTMGTKHRITFGLFVVKGSINCQLAEKTGFTDEDAEKIKEALQTLFENDASSARPEGSVEVCRLYWWRHAEKTPAVSTAKVHRSLKIVSKVETPLSFADYEIQLNNPENCVEPEIYNNID